MPNQFSATRSPIFPVGPSIAYIPLTRGNFALIDSDSLPSVSAYQWYAHDGGGMGLCYAVRNLQKSEGRGDGIIRMHQVIHPNAKIVDHKNHNGLDNRHCNLRESDFSLNGFNRRVQSYGKSGIHGIRFVGGKWQARIRHKRKDYYLGSFATPELARAAYVEAREKIISGTRQNGIY